MEYSAHLPSIDFSGKRFLLTDLRSYAQRPPSLIIPSSAQTITSRAAYHGWMILLLSLPLSKHLNG